jgi:hypothetical protein
MAAATGAYLHQLEESELRWLGETSAYFLATGGEQTGGHARPGRRVGQPRGERPAARPPGRHGVLAITLPSRAGGLPPLEWIDGSQIKRASKEYGVEFVGPLPDER